MLAMSARRALRVLLVSFAALAAAGPPAASATTVDYGDDGLTLTVTDEGDESHDIQFRLSGDTTRDHILDTAGFSSVPGDCIFESSNTWITCPGKNTVRVDLGGGDDDVTFASQGYDCFEHYSLNFGDGVNTLTLSGNCGDSATDAADVSSGSGPDRLTAGSQGPMNTAAGGGDDSVYGSAGDDVVHGGDGADRLFGNAGNDQLLGEGGADVPNGGPGNDLVDGGDGNDGLELCSNCIGSNNDPGEGADTYVGGPGADNLWLDGHATGMAISLDGQANDGSGGEGDNVGTDIEAIEGTVYNDVYFGTEGRDVFSANGGNDEVHGGGGNDDLYGSSGDDTMFGDAGVDKVEGASDADTVDGGPGADQLYGDIAGCSVFCTADSDTLRARDGERDTVDCGGGADAAQVDFADVVAFCTVVDRSPDPGSAPPPGSGPPAGGGTPASAFALQVGSTVRSASLRRRGLTLRLKCPAACTVVAQLRLGSRLVGSGRKARLSAGAVRVVVKLSKKGKRALRRLRRARLKLRVKITDASGTATTINRTVVLRR
jgi:Ca2+-binding RTX toxin-like protein